MSSTTGDKARAAITAISLLLTAVTTIVLVVQWKENRELVKMQKEVALLNLKKLKDTKN